MSTLKWFVLALLVSLNLVISFTLIKSLQTLSPRKGVRRDVRSASPTAPVLVVVDAPQPTLQPLRAHDTFVPNDSPFRTPAGFHFPFRSSPLSVDSVIPAARHLQPNAALKQQRRPSLSTVAHWNQFDWVIPAHESPLSTTHTLSSISTTLLGAALTACKLPVESLDARAAVNFACLLHQYDIAARRLGSASDSSARMPSAVLDRCTGHFGYRILEQLRQSASVLCDPTARSVTLHDQVTLDTHIRVQRSEISCLEYRPQHHATPTEVCTASNVSIAVDKIANGQYPWMTLQSNALVAQCHLTQSKPERKKAFIHCQADWLVDALGSATNQDTVCDVVIDTPTLALTRSGDYSPFAMAHDVLNAILLYAAGEFRPGNMSVWVFDRMPLGFYAPVWQWVFSPLHDVLFMEDIRERYSGRSVCFRALTFNIPARLSLLYDDLKECGGDGAWFGPIVRLSADWLLFSFDAYLTTPDPSVLTVRLILRKNYEATGHKISRRFGNAEALLRALQDMSIPSALGFALEVSAVDYAEHIFPQQLNLSRSTDVLVAMHGAGLIHAMFLPPHAGVFEFFCPDRPSGNYRYNRLSKSVGVVYDSFDIKDTRNVVDLDVAVPKVQALVNLVAARKRAKLSA